jgi:molybdate transport system substrate-binding protein
MNDDLMLRGPHGSRLSCAALRVPTFFLCMLLSPFACLGAQSSAAELHIAAAADLEPVLPLVLQQFEKQTGIHATASYQSSATLTQEILSGAPFDIFFSADMSFPQKVIDAGSAKEISPVAYARGTLVLWARKDAAVLKHGALSLETLRDRSLQSVAIANPQHAPYGRAAQAAIKELKLDAVLQPKLRIAANIAQTAQYLDSGNAEAGFISLTSARTVKLSEDGTFVEVPLSAYPPLLQGAVILKHAPHEVAAEKLLHFMQLPDTRATLARLGLNAPQ